VQVGRNPPPPELPPERNFGEKEKEGPFFPLPISLSPLSRGGEIFVSKGEIPIEKKASPVSKRRRVEDSRKAQKVFATPSSLYQLSKNPPPRIVKEIPPFFLSPPRSHSAPGFFFPPATPIGASPPPLAIARRRSLSFFFLENSFGSKVSPSSFLPFLPKQAG